jgi:hypothetical protein
MLGQTISHYRIVSQLGVGGMDIVGPREAYRWRSSSTSDASSFNTSPIAPALIARWCASASVDPVTTSTRADLNVEINSGKKSSPSSVFKLRSRMKMSGAFAFATSRASARFEASDDD